MTPREIGELARERRRELQLRQLELAQLAQVSERFVRDLETGKPGIRLDKLIAVVGVLGFDLSLKEHVPPALRSGKP
ncbi:helix-turn-helix domain-containing protein [Corynebacterium sp. zg-331]|uniref:helix-turn-helix domain-containing protein n=1 Tax=unclassified Corynebacterium TaxID=2624378 RepID=UPI00128B2EC6|nr:MULTISPECIES: helix-turn-helix domain-containing protein [unclassified Corynebacterium]MBC3185528.1 helix-turn-helix domain-containing protein [Corynebacterium sp. zg-331]MPV52022.1 helix-turn-helix domain-containing protein [Corynebacterium sp. zg331]